MRPGDGQTAQTRPAWWPAAAFAARMHHGQTRRDGTTPYFAHPARVAMVVRDVFGCDDPIAIAAAYLHDVIEDTPADFDDVVELAGDEVAAVVAALTKDMRTPEATREPAYDEGLAAADWRARLIKLADVFDNLSDLPKRSRTDRARDKARRAIELARADSDRPETQRALAAVEGLLASMGDRG